MKKSAYLLMGLFAAIVVAVGVVACSGSGNKENDERNDGYSYANFRGGDHRDRQAVRNERPANNDNKLVGRWKLDDKEYGSYMSKVYVFNRDNTGYGEMRYNYGRWEEPYRIDFSYRYNDRKSEITVAFEGYRSDFETSRIEWFGDNRFYTVDKYGDKEGPFVRQ